MRPGSHSSRQRMLRALKCTQPDHVPCSFMLFGALKGQCSTYAEFIERQVAMGLDAFVQLPPRPPIVVDDHYNLHGLPVSYDPRVTINEWVEHPAQESWPILVKEYHTPAGVLRAEVRKTDDWRWGDHVPFLDDYIVPRSRMFLVTTDKDVESLKYLLVPPTAEERNAFFEESAASIAQAKRLDLLLAGGWGVGADLIGWIHGLENLVFTTYDRPEMLRSLLALIAEWNRARMDVVLEAGIDLYIKRAWYENLDFWTPASWREFLFPILQAEARQAHERGALFGYLITSNVMPLLESIAEAGVDVLIGVDPMRWDLAEAKRRLAGRVCLWGGINGHLTVEAGTPDVVRDEVRRAVDVLAPGGGFILSPVDNVRQDTPTSRRNVEALVAEWRRQTGREPAAGREEA